MKTNQRLHILNPEDVATLYERPEFTDVERRHFFELPQALLAELAIAKKNGRRVAGIVYFILQYGYFKAKHRFFTLDFTEVKGDIDFIMQHYLPNDVAPTKNPSASISCLISI